MMSSLDDVVVDFSTHEITNSVLVLIAMKIVRLRQVAKELGYDSNEIDKLCDVYHDSTIEWCYQTLLQWWERPPHDSSVKLKQLHRSLCNTGQSECLQNVFTENENYKSITYLSSQSIISEEILTRNINGNISLLNVAAQYLSGKCRIVGRLLELEEHEIDEIHCNYSQERERAYRVLSKWRDEKGSRAKVSQLVAALLAIKQHTALRTIKKKLMAE